jgi:hypothetical protein
MFNYIIYMLPASSYPCRADLRQIIEPKVSQVRNYHNITGIEAAHQHTPRALPIRYRITRRRAT